MSTTTTNRHIDIGALPFPASARWDDINLTVTADVPKATLEAAVASAPLDTRDTNEATIRQQAVAALAANKAFVAQATPTAPQLAAQVKALSRQQNQVIRLLLGRLDATD